MSRVLAISFGVGITLALSGCGGGESCVDVLSGLDASCAVLTTTSCQEKEKFCDKCGSLNEDGAKKLAAANATVRACLGMQNTNCACKAMLSSVALPADKHTNTTFSTV